MDYEISYNFRMGKEILPAVVMCYATEVASILRNMALLAMDRGYQFSNVTMKRR